MAEVVKTVYIDWYKIRVPDAQGDKYARKYM